MAHPSSERLTRDTWDCRDPRAFGERLTSVSGLFPISWIAEPEPCQEIASQGPIPFCEASISGARHSDDLR